MDALGKEDIHTIDDIYALPEGERAELIDGKIYYMAPPGTKHQSFVSDLHYQIKDYIKRNNGACEVFPAPFAVFLNADDKNVEPDISVICDWNKLTEKEIVTVYSLKKETMEQYSFGNSVPVEIYDGFSIKI